MNEPICSFDGCDRPPKARGWCPMHYGRWRRHGDPATSLPPGMSGCTHGMPSKASCVDCMFDEGLGTTVPAVHRGIYARCVDLARGGMSDVDIPARVEGDLTADERAELVMVGLRVYAAQARRAADLEARRAALISKPTPKGEGLGESKAMARIARAMGVSAATFARYQDESFLRSEVALGEGRRVARGDLTISDIESKLAALESQRQGIGTTMADFEQHLEILRRTSAKSLNELRAKSDEGVAA
jgi:hypothetical protein